jgi:hypothetical protein
MPMDQPAAALEMITRFTNNVSFADEILPTEASYESLGIAAGEPIVFNDDVSPAHVARPATPVPKSSENNDSTTQPWTRDRVIALMLHYWNIILDHLKDFRATLSIGLLAAIIVCCMCCCCCWCFSRRQKKEITRGSITYTDWKYVPVPEEFSDDA